MSAARAAWRDVPVPDRMQRLDKDKRGLPIPFTVLRDPGTGKPNFTISDTSKVARALRDDLCAICGQTLLRGRWFVGGPLCAYNERGAYLDGPSHNECAHYALQVCPYLAAPRYDGRLDDLGFDWNAHPNMVMLRDDTMIPDRPDLFVAVMAVGQRMVGDPLTPYFKPKRPFRRVEFWRHGEELPFFEGAALSKVIVDAFVAREVEAAARGLPRMIPRPQVTG